MQAFSVVQPDQYTSSEGLITKIFQQERCSLQLAHLGECRSYPILTRIGSQLAHQQAGRDGSMTDGGSDTPHPVALLGNEFGIDLAKLGPVEVNVLAYFL